LVVQRNAWHDPFIDLYDTDSNALSVCHHGYLVLPLRIS
jgi:hypothetical protein